ncbi:SIMPL domain-containing protein [Woeseia oceani]|uniref:SIMPL domain-containing protein n=1 Tax=Woeseia oceani TaxID=1548547 RepID=A0A193LJF3_9GAMM|nr:SIMPL domain-containing protein [Woeseia oceani]ANO52563.1 hypothetical protein BA177_16445 [Woeseia oceani]
MSGRAGILNGLLVAIGLAIGGYFIGDGFVSARALERSVEVKGLAERDVMADTAIWPMQIMVAGNELEPLFIAIEKQGAQVQTFLRENGFIEDEISVSAPSVVDRLARDYSDPNTRFRYSVTQVITVFTSKIETVRNAGQELAALGKAGIVLNQNDYNFQTQYLFNGLNDLKPAMIEEATRNAREVAAKFAEDSASRLGRIRNANQGQFQISDRDSNNPHIKKVRVVSTISYYLVD